MKVAIVGGGVSGLGALWALKDSEHEVHLYESSPSIGGHANTAVFEHDGQKTDVDTGFIVFNETNYRRHLDVPSIESSISFSLSRDNGRYEWSGQSPSTFFAQRRRLLSFRKWRMLFDFVRFNHFALDILRRPSTRRSAERESIASYLERKRYSKEFRDDFLIPMCAAIWSAPLGDFSLHFPAESLVRYLWNHQLLSATDAHSTWRTVKGGSRVYIEALTTQVMKTGRCKIFTDTAVQCVEETTNGRKILRFGGGEELEYDHVIFATHADTTKRMLGNNATAEEASLLDKFQFTDNEVVLHSDLSVSLSHFILTFQSTLMMLQLMPKQRRVWAAWNYLTSSGLSKRAPICVTFWMNRLQQISPSFGPVLVTLNPTHQPAKDLVQGRWSFRHPLFSVESMEAQRLLPNIQNKRGISFAGAWTNFGFHEDGFSSGVRVAMQHLGAKIPFEFRDSDLLWKDNLRISWRIWLGRVGIAALLVSFRTLSVVFSPVTFMWDLSTSFATGLAHFLTVIATTFWFRHV
ncbi:MAG: hypothetical protein Q9160_004216 [Pyrenula sp. 1 TL-2023]